MHLLSQSVRFPALSGLLILAPDCSAGTSAASCNLSGLLHVLYVVAAILAVILILVIAFAVHAWRKTKEAELTRQ